MPPMPKELRDWLIKNFEDCENGKLTQDQRIKFLDLVGENLGDKEFEDAFKEYEKTKRI
tara:strand:+ start:3073 stop:3249 length:177 start_codon:yes stop_codon:yes gene_type:complete